jgi:hypothetical protein
MGAEGLTTAADAIKAVKYGDADHECSPHEEVGFLMLAQVYHFFVIDHTKRP